MQKQARVGVIRWDSCVDSNLYFSYYAAKVLSPRHYHDRVAFYGNILESGQVEFPRYTIDTFNREMEYAIEAGIDYFVYFYYTMSTERTTEYGNSTFTVDAFGLPCHELNMVQRIHVQSPYRDRINMCFHLSSCQLSEKDLELICDTMAQDYYEKIDGRPLLYVYDFPDEKTVAACIVLAERAQQKGLKKPYIVSDRTNDLDGIDFDAFSAYSMPSSSKPMTDFDTYNEVVIARNQSFFGNGKGVVPHLSMGWNPMPRIENSVPWYSYRTMDYPPAPKSNQLLDQAKMLKALANAQAEFIHHYIVFAWNEFEEGAWICPTLDPNEKGRINTSHLEQLKAAIAYLKE